MLTRPNMGFTNSKKIAVNSRLKFAIYGEVGVGKTMLALSFPNLAVLDYERGTAPYVDKFDFDVDFISTADEAEAAVRGLAKDPDGHTALLIDPISKYCTAVGERRRLVRIKETGNPDYELDFRNDFGVIKRDIANFVTDLLKLDMNIIVTARRKSIYAKTGFMNEIGCKPDMHVLIGEIFDTIIYAEVDVEGRRIAYTSNPSYPNGEIVAKDRYSLPGAFELSYDNLINGLGEVLVTHEPAEPVNLDTFVTTPMTQVARDFETEMDGEPLLTAGITGAQIESIRQKVGTDETRQNQFASHIQSKYGVSNMYDLRGDEAELILSSFK